MDSKGGVRLSSASINLKKDDTDSLLGGAIQLNERQLQMMAARKQGRTMIHQKYMDTSSVHQPSQNPQSNPDMQKLQKLVMEHGKSRGASSSKQGKTVASSASTADEQYWAQQPTNTVETVPTTWSESAASEAGSSTSSASAALSFYGQRLAGQEKKLYDDTGATWSDSRSEATTATAVQSRATSAHLSASALSTASFTARSHRSRLSVASSPQNNQMEMEQKKRDAPSVQLAGSNSIAASSLYVQPKDAIRQDSAMRTALEPDESLTPMDSRSESIADAEPPPLKSPVCPEKDVKATPQSKHSRFQTIKSLKKTSKKGNQDKNLASMIVSNIVGRSALTSARKQKPIKSSKLAAPKEVVEESASDVSARSSEQGSRKGFSWGMRSPRSTSSGSSITHADKARMMRMNRIKDIFTGKTSSAKDPPKETDVLDKKEASQDKELEHAPSDEVEQEDTFDPGSLSLTPLKMGAPKRNRGRRSSVRMRVVASGAMNDLLEENVFPDSDDEEEELEVDKITEDKTVVSLHDVIEDDEVETEVSGQSEQADGEISNAPTARADRQITSSQWTSDVSTEQEASRAEKNAPFAHATQRALDRITNNDAEGFDDFVSNLRSELSASHTKIYDQFHHMIRENKSRPKPLSMYPCGLDLKSRETITTMSNFAKKAPCVDYTTGSQIASDKDVEKVQSTNKVTYGQHILNPTKQRLSLTHQKIQPERQEIDDATVDGQLSLTDSESYGLYNAPSSDTISAGSQGAAYEVTLSQHMRKSFVPSPNTASDSCTSLASKMSFADKKNHGSADSIAPSNDSVFEDEKKNRCGRPPMPSKAISPKMFVPTAPKETIAWNSVKLRSVSENSRGSTVDDAIPASWAKVKLRSVAKNDEKAKLIDTSAESIETGEFHRIVLRKTPRSAETPKTNIDLALAPSASTEVSGTVTKPIDLERQADKDHPIKLSETRGTDHRPIRIEDHRSGTEENPILLVNEGSVMIALVNENPSQDGMESKLLLNKKGLMKVEAIPGESKANVLWRLDREDVKSALLNMSSFEAKLILSSSGEQPKDLSFATSEQCKKFANAIHELLHGSNNRVPDEVSVDVVDCVSVSTKSESSIFVEQLSEDEQKVLEEFRQRKKAVNDPKIDFAKEFLNQRIGSMLIKPPSVVNASFSGPASPLSEVSGANSLLLMNQPKIAETYQRMLRMKVPKDAVKHKMMQDRVDPKIIESVLGEESNSALIAANGEKLSPDANEIADSYRKMLKMGIPAEGVRHKMQKDGIDAEIIASVLVEDIAPQPLTSAPVTKLSLVEEAVAETYKKMFKMMIPKEAVQHRMIKDGVDPKIMAAVIGKPPEQAPSNSNCKASSSRLTDTEESIASAYRKMLKLSIPKEAVRHKMIQEGISEKIMTAVLGAHTQQKSGQQKNKRNGFKPGFHWNPIADDESIAGSVWSKTKPMSEDGNQRPASIIDITKHVEMFQKQPETAVQRKKNGQNPGSDSKEMAKLIDLNRANNVAITLKAFNDFSHKELAQLIEFLDPHAKIKGDRALFMKDLLPSSAESKAIKGYKGCDDRLVGAEKWFKHIVHIKRIEDKIQIMRTLETFQMDAVVLGKSFQLLKKACNQVMDSDRLPDLLDMVRQIGNTMNEGRGEAAAGFKLDFLPRLSQTKGSDKKTTALDLVVMLFHTRNKRDALMLSEEIPDCQEASRMQLSDLMTDVRSLESSLRKCQQELEQLKKEMESEHKGKAPPPHGIVPPDARSETALNKPLIGSNPRHTSKDAQTDIGASLKERTHMLASALGQQQNASPALCAVQKSTQEEKNSISPRTSLMAALQENNGNSLEFSLDASVRRLEKFVGEANCIILPRLESDRVAAVEACQELASFFCESGGERTAANLLKILDEFATDINRAVVKYDHQQKVDARKKASQKRKSLIGSKPPAPENLCSVNHTTGSLLLRNKNGHLSARSSANRSQEPEEEQETKSLVLMVNEMLKVAGDKQVEDFKQGIVYEDADERFKRIYNAEQSRKADPLAARREMMSAISKPSTGTGTLRDAQNAASALSELRVSLGGAKSNGCEEDDKLSEMPPSKQGKRKSNTAERWSRKVKEEHFPDVQDENDKPLERTDSEILTSMSDVEENTASHKKRQSYADRWASRTPVSLATVRDLDEESDIGAFEEMLKKQRQKAVNRWARKPSDEEEIIE
jgi:hypothetical protein